jgi:hypothetical protein
MKKRQQARYSRYVHLQARDVAQLEIRREAHTCWPTGLDSNGSRVVPGPPVGVEIRWNLVNRCTPENASIQSPLRQ